MPRANRHFLPGHIWHITHRCHRKLVQAVQPLRSFNTAASSNRSSRSTAMLSSNRLKKLTWNFEIREFSKLQRWSEAIAVGSLTFVEKVKSELGCKAVHRE
jgi:hypothetical protein